MGLLGSLFSAAADIAKETITETMNQNETERYMIIWWPIMRIPENLIFLLWIV